MYLLHYHEEIIKETFIMNFLFVEIFDQFNISYPN